MKYFLNLISVFFFANLVLFGQVQDYKKLPFQDFQNDHFASSIVGSKNGTILFFWIENQKLYSSKSSDYGENWSQPMIITTDLIEDSLGEINSFKIANGKIFLTFRRGTSGHVLLISSDNGDNWSNPINLPTGNPIQRRNSNSLQFFESNSGTIFLIYNRIYNRINNLYLISSNDEGITWSSEKLIFSDASNGGILQIDTNKFLLVFQKKNSNNIYDIYNSISLDQGITWSEPEILFSSSNDKNRPRVWKNINGELYIFYEENISTPFQNIFQSDLKYIKSIDDGVNWSIPENSSLTNYKGNDLQINVSEVNNKIIFSFLSQRGDTLEGRKKSICYGILNEYGDLFSPPFLYKSESIPNVVPTSTPFFIRAYVDDDDEIQSVRLRTNLNGVLIDTVEMFDDGLNNDSLANDKIYGVSINGLNIGDGLLYFFDVIDNDQNKVSFIGDTILIPFHIGDDAFQLYVNNISIPINNRGVLANLDAGSGEGGKINDIVFLFSGGFLLSGYSNGEMWTNGVASASRIEDYLPGQVGSIPLPINKLFMIRSTDPPFGQTWQDWKYAVQQGADFYDGNNDGIYNPIDLNNNGKWDINEDSPDILGDETLWCVYNDGVTPYLRRFNDVLPQGIEIHQTVFAFSTRVPSFSNSFFVRYKIINKGTVAQQFDSVYFSVWADPDLGDPVNDLVGSDTLRNSIYTYNQGPDDYFGYKPPSVFLTSLQNPITYIPGITFIDNNLNEIYEEGIDTPIDTAKIMLGPIRGIKSFPGANNMNISSAMHYMNDASTPLRDPDNKVEARNLMLGKTNLGGIIDPCNWNYGTVVGQNCADVNPRFMYSGDPVTNSGWINNIVTDQRTMLNIGPFVLKENEPQEILITYVVGRGNDALNSIEVTRNYVDYIKGEYEENFVDITTDVNDQFSGQILTYELSQNYPNPFNPSTTINYQIPKSGFVSLKVYDILGREVAVLVNGEKEMGRYTVQFDGSKLASGVYIYELRANEFVSVKKLMLLK